MCECCSQHAAKHQGHVHINGIDSKSCFQELETVLCDVPGVVSVEFIEGVAQVKVVFDKRILEVTGLEQLLDKNGFALS